MPKPSAGHVKLEKLAGRWEGEERMYPSQWDPKGGTAIGRTTSRMALDGFALIGEYEQERNGIITFSGHSVFTFDAHENLYSLHWFDCLGTPPELFTGRFEGDILTVAHGGPGMHARLTYDISDPQHLASKMEMAEDGKNWKTLFDGRYRRN
ncbi:MAG TPA: DUF1579 family protein [Gemmatimonadales bacterium]|nr:DUF1579 family protein [Gemmatimonadales bacterium]